MSGFAVLCPSGVVKVTNASPYTGTDIHPTVVFEESAGIYEASARSFKDTSLSSTTLQPSGVQLVGCVTRDTSFAGNVLKTCPIPDAKKVTVNVDYISAKYTLDVFEATTGKKVGTSKLASTSSTCPEIASFTTPDPKVFVAPETADVEAAIVAYSAKK